MRQATRTLASLWWTSLLLIGLPAALVRLVGWPLPSHLPTGDEWAAWLQQPLTRATLISAAAIVAWAMWAALLAVVLASAYRGIARLCRHLPDIRLPGPLQGLSAAMLGTVAVSTSVAAASPPAAAHAAVAAADTTHPARPDLATDRRLSAPTAPRPLAASTDLHADQPRPHTVTVRRGDTLWDIAGAWLGDHTRWPEIYRLNADRYDQHGRMKHGDHIEPGWVLVLPDDAQPPAGAVPTPPTSPAGQQPPPAPPPCPTPPAPGASGPAPSAPATTAPTPSATVAPTAPAAGGPPATPAPTSTQAAAASPSPTATDASPSSRSPRANPPGISLPGGSWVDLGLAAAIAAAATLVWIQRRRRYVPRPPSPVLRLDDPDLAPMPPVVTQVRRGLRQILHHGADDADEPGQVPETGAPAEADATAQPQAPLDAAPQPVAPALDHSLLEVWPPAGLGLTGPGGEAAARGFLVAALACGGHEEPEARGRVVIPAAALATLLGTQAVTVADTGRLTVTPGLPEALDALEEHTLHRTRLVFDHEVDTVTALRDADPAEEPLPPLLLIADTGAIHERARIAALLTQGQRLDIHGVLLGVWDDGTTVHVAADGATTPADPSVSRHGTHPADVGRLAVLDPTETADLLRTLAEAHTGQPQPAPPVEHSVPAGSPPANGKAPNEKKAADARPVPADETSPPHAATADGRHDDQYPSEPGIGDHAFAAEAQPEAGEQLLAARHPPVDDAGPQPGIDDADSEPDDEPDGGAHVEDDIDLDDDATGEGRDTTDESTEPETARPGRARACVLGPPRIADLPPPRQPREQGLRSKALEVLVYLIAVGGQAPQHRVIADVLPNELHSRAHHRLNTYVSNLRKSLSRAGGKATYVAGPDEQYALGRDTLEVDLWRMQTAIVEAEAATDPPARAAALRQAVACYTGPLAEGRDYEWVEPFREAVRQQAIDAHLALVAAVGDDDPAEALTVLRAAIGHDPHNEPLYQQAMHLSARLGDVEGIRDLRRTLTRVMGAIDSEPGDDTLTLADRLVTDLQRRPRQPRPLRGDAA